jgi:hypothetical protein
MKTNYYSVILFAAFLFAGCKKEKNGDDLTCQNIQNATLFSNSPVLIGETIHFGTQEVDGYRIYSWVGPYNYADQYPEASITDAQLQNEGWYYLHLYNPSNCEKIDSIYIDITLPQGSPPCAINNNITDYSNLGTDNYSSVRKYIDPNFSQKVLEGSGAGSNLTVYFHTHWRAFEPEDGIYTTVNTPVFDQADNNYNKVFITTTKSSIYWGTNEGQNVYISHVGSKLQVRFCDLLMGGNNGMSYTTEASGNIVEQ